MKKLWLLAIFSAGCGSSCTHLFGDRAHYRVTMPSAWREQKALESAGFYVSVDEERQETLVINPPHREPLPRNGIPRYFFDEVEPQVKAPSYQRVSVEFLEVAGSPAIDWWYHLDVEGRTRLRGQRLIFRGGERLFAAVSSPDLDSDRVKAVVHSFRPSE